MKPQRIRILAQLTRRNLCSTTILAMRIPRGAARISELRSQGWQIETRECRQHTHPTRQIEYVLHNSPGVMYTDAAAEAS